MLEPILKGLVEWLYSMMLDIMNYASGELLGVMSMDLSYFERTAPIITDIVNVFISLGWALLIGNLVFQSLKVMMSGAGFEAEDPKLLFFRTFVFSFLLLASRQICEIGSSITGTVINLLDLPDSITVTVPDESMFSLGGGAKWLLVIIVGVVLMVQMVKLLFEIGERYVITSVLTFFAPLAFSMGGSKNTNDIFKGWVRMYCSMLVMMIMNIVFLKLIMSAMSQMMSGGILIWLVFVVALTRVARKIDSHIGKIGLNPAQTGDGIGSRIPGVMTMMAVRVMSSTVSKSLAGGRGSSSTRQRSRNTGGFQRNGQQRGGFGSPAMHRAAQVRTLPAEKAAVLLQAAEQDRVQRFIHKILPAATVIPRIRRQERRKYQTQMAVIKEAVQGQPIPILFTTIPIPQETVHRIQVHTKRKVLRLHDRRLTVIRTEHLIHRVILLMEVFIICRHRKEDRVQCTAAKSREYIKLYQEDKTAEIKVWVLHLKQNIMPEMSAIAKADLHSSRAE